MVLGNKSPNVIADSLHLSIETVISYQHRAFEKLGVKNDVQLNLFAVWQNIIELEIRESAGGEEVFFLPSRKGPLAPLSLSDSARLTS